MPSSGLGFTNFEMAPVLTPLFSNNLHFTVSLLVKSLLVSGKAGKLDRFHMDCAGPNVQIVRPLKFHIGNLGRVGGEDQYL